MPAIRLVSQRHGHLFNIPCCQTTALCAEPDKRRNRSVCNQISVGKGKSAFTVIPLSQERWCPCSSISNFAAYDIVEHNSRLAKLYNTNLRNSHALNPQANSTERNDANNEISLDLQIHPIATDNKDDVRMRHEKINIKYDWMVNPRPFYRKDGKKQKQDETVLKRDRTTFNTRQRNELERQFQLSKYPSRYRRLNLAHCLELSEFQVKVWFQNRRMKHKRWENAEKQSGSGLPRCYCGCVAKGFL